MSNKRRFAALGVIGITLAVVYGIWYAYSVILVALLAEFGWSRSVLAGAFSVFTLVHGGLNPWIGALCARLGAARVMAAGGAATGLALFADSFIASPTHLYLAFGVATALSISLAGWVPALVYVQRGYQDRLGFAIGIVSAGVGVGMLVVVPLTQVLIDAFGWRAAFQVLGVVAAAWIVPSSLWLARQPRTEKWGQTPQKPEKGSVPIFRDVTLRQAMRTEPFWLMVACYFFGNVCAQMLHVHQVAYLVELGFAAIVAASVVGAVGLASIVAKTGGGWLSDRIGREVVYLTGIGIMGAGALWLIVLGAAPTTWGAYGYAVLQGAGYSVTAAIIPAMVSDRYSGRHFGAIIGACLVGSAAGSALGPWIAGAIYDAAGSYTLAFLIAAGCAAAAAGAGWRAWRLRKSTAA